MEKVAIGSTMYTGGTASAYKASNVLEQLAAYLYETCNAFLCTVGNPQPCWCDLTDEEREVQLRAAVELAGINIETMHAMQSQTTLIADLWNITDVVEIAAEAFMNSYTVID